MYYNEKIIKTVQHGDFTVVMKEQRKYNSAPKYTRFYYELVFNKPELLEKLIKDCGYYYDKFMDELDYSSTVDPESEDARFLEHLQHQLWRKVTIINNLLGSDMYVFEDAKTSKVLRVEYCPENNPERYHEYTWEEDDDFEIEGYDDIEIEVYDEE